MPPPDWINLKEAGELLGCSARTARRMMARHTWRTRLTACPSGAQVRMVARENILAHIRAALPAEVRDNLARDSDSLARDNLPAQQLAPVLEGLQELTRAMHALAAALNSHRALPLPVESAGPGLDGLDLLEVGIAGAVVALALVGLALLALVV